MTAYDTYNRILFTNSVLGLLWRTGLDGSVLGYTAADGTVTTTDSLLFPSVLHLPPLRGTTPDGEELGTFAVLDSITVVLSDTITAQKQTYRRRVQGGVNLIRLNWAPQSSAAKRPSAEKPGGERLRLGSSAAAWCLDPFVPNPFN